MEYEIHIAAMNEVGASDNATEQLITPTGVPDGEPQNIRYTIFRNKVSPLIMYLQFLTDFFLNLNFKFNNIFRNI
jgi:hypothetical protein